MVQSSSAASNSFDLASPSSADFAHQPHGVPSPPEVSAVVGHQRVASGFAAHGLQTQAICQQAIGPCTARNGRLLAWLHLAGVADGGADRGPGVGAAGEVRPVITSICQR